MSTVPTSTGYSCLESGHTWVEDFKHSHCCWLFQTDENSEKARVIHVINSGQLMFVTL